MDVQDRPTLQHYVVVRTPENIELTYSLAGIGSRAAALLLDMSLLGVAAQLLGNLLVMVFMLPLGPDLAVAVVSLLGFFAMSAYFVVSEWIWGGRTPGKKFVGLRVIKEGGYALGFMDAVVRNLMRVVDMLPVMYALGIVSVLMTRNGQRLGDLAAGTLVVHQEPLQAHLLMPNVPEVSQDRLPLTVEQVAKVPARVIDLAVEFFGALDQLAPRYRQELAVELSDLALKTGGLALKQTYSAETILAAIIQGSGRIHPSSLPEQVPAARPSSPGAAALFSARD